MACSFEPTTCADAACDPTGEFCVFFPSDFLPEPDKAACLALPEECGDTPTCECLIVADDPFTTCARDDDDDVFVVTHIAG